MASHQPLKRTMMVHIYTVTISKKKWVFRTVKRKKEVQIGWECREIRIWEQPTKGVLKKTIIRSVLDESAEFNLVNSYNKHILGVKEDATALDEYKEYLRFTEDVDKMLLTDFSTETK
jgi:hypothetical protein